MVDSIINCATPDEADALLISAPCEHGASFGGGASRGPAAIIACLDRQIELFERHTRTEPAYHYRIAHRELAEIGALAPAAMVAQVAAAVPRAPDDDSDYNDADPSRYAHSCVMRRARELGYRTCSVGIRAYSRAEHRYAASEGLPVFEWGRGTAPATGEVLAAIATERVYLTIDVDGFDPSVAPATGTPVPGGLSWAYGTRLVRELFLAKDVVGADIVEVAPIAGSALTEYAAAQLCYDILSYRLLKRDRKLVFV
ncbi:MAG: speB1 [Geminicoccaceae bacterium]|nr:speB1 [Geminicoccaceae bacterium]